MLRDLAQKLALTELTVCLEGRLSHSAPNLEPTLLNNPRSLPHRTALVVGAEPDFAATVATILPDWKIERVRDNVAALAFINSRAFDLVLTGESTSGEADVELLRRIRLVRPHTRLIILTNESTPSDVIASMREHAFSYFSKPLCWTITKRQSPAHSASWRAPIS